MSDAGPARSSRLGRLDERVVPALRRGARAVARVVSSPARAVLSAEDHVFGGRVGDFGVRNRTALTFVVVALATAGAAVHFDRYPDLRDEQRAEVAAAREQTVRDAGSGGSRATAVGPTRDVSVAGYLDDWQDELDEVPADAERTAVVSFDDFVTPDEVAEVLPADTTPRLVQYRLQIDGAAPGSGGSNTVTDGAPVLEAEVIAGDVENSVATVVDTLLEEIVTEEAELTSMLETTDEPSFRADFENRLEELAALRSTLGSGGRIVFAVVVTGSGEDLRTIAAADEVRVVDVAPDDVGVDDADFYGLLPTDDDEVTFGQFG